MPMPEIPTTDAHATSLIPHGSLLTTFEDLDRVLTSGSGWLPVVVDRWATPWILFCNEDGGTCAATVPFPDLAIPSHIDLGALPARGPLRVVFNGYRNNPDWPESAQTKEARA
jgi:hypothetical protein